ncbi:MAG: glycosyltransferase [Acidobacteriota bacterium]
MPRPVKKSNLKYRKPKVVSVIIPCYNHAGFLQEAIDSVLQQTYKDFEILVIDDGSTDKTSAIAASFSAVRYVYQNNQGLSAARNRGISESLGEFLVFLDADDRLLPKALEIGVKALSLRPDCAFVYGRSQYINDKGKHIPVNYPEPVLTDHYLALLHSNHIWMPAQVMYRSKVFDEVRGFNPSISAAADYELYLRITRRFPVYNHLEIVAEYRQQLTSMSRNYRLMLTTTMRALNSQKPAIRDEPDYLNAYRAGKKLWQSYYGEGCVDQFRKDLRKPGRKAELFKAMIILLRYYPQGVVKHLRKKLTLMLKRPPEIRSTPSLK